MAQSSSLQSYTIKVFDISLMNKVLKGNVFLSEWAVRIGRKALFSPGALLSTVSGVHAGLVLRKVIIVQRR
jgi:hypothetical protein